MFYGKWATYIFFNIFNTDHTSSDAMFSGLNHMLTVSKKTVSHYF